MLGYMPNPKMMKGTRFEDQIWKLGDFCVVCVVFFYIIEIGKQSVDLC